MLFHRSGRTGDLGRKILTSVTEMQLSLPHVGLRLKQPNPQIELGGHIDLLISGQVQNVFVHCIAVMTSDKRDVAVASVTEFSTAVANGSALLCQGRRAGDRGEQNHEESCERAHRPSVRGCGGSGSVCVDCIPT